MCGENHVTSGFVLSRAVLRNCLRSADMLWADYLLVGSELLLDVVSGRLEAYECDVGYTLKPDARPRTLTEQERTSCD